MEQEKFEEAVEIKAKIKQLRKLQNEANRIWNNHENYGMCNQYFGDIIKLILGEYNYRQKIDDALFGLLFEFKEKIIVEINNLEEKFERL